MDENGFNENKSEENKVEDNSAIREGISFGTCLAMVISYTTWHSIPWAIFHGFLSWFYVIYYIFTY